MATRTIIRLACVGFGLVALGCDVDEPCQDNDAELVKKFGIPTQQTEGADGLCYPVDPARKNWGQACDSLNLCGGGLICAAPDLPICTAIDCNPDTSKDKVCGAGFMCIATGKETPSICVPLPPPTPSVAPTTSNETTDTTADGGAADAASNADTAEAAPNVGTPCTSAADPVCVGGTFCETQSLDYCTLNNCAEGLENAAACAAVGFCYSSAPAPATGVCTVQ